MYTFLTVLHVVVCVFLVLVVLLQAGRGGGIGLAFGGSGGSQSVFGSSGGANFLTKMTAVCAVLFMANSLTLAYMSSQSDSRRLQRIAEKNALAKKAEDAANAKMLTDIEKQRKEKAKAEAEASKTSEGSPAEGAATEEGAPGVEEKAPAAEDKSVADKTALGLKLTMPGAPATGKLPVDLKLGKTHQPPAEDSKAGKPAKAMIKKMPAMEKKPAAEKPTAEDKPAAEETTAAKEKPSAKEKAASKKPADEPAEKPAAEKKTAEGSGEKPAAE